MELWKRLGTKLLEKKQQTQKRESKTESEDDTKTVNIKILNLKKGKIDKGKEMGEKLLEERQNTPNSMQKQSIIAQMQIIYSFKENLKKEEKDLKIFKENYNKIEKEDYESYSMRAYKENKEDLFAKLVDSKSIQTIVQSKSLEEDNKIKKEQNESKENENINNFCNMIDEELFKDLFSLYKNIKSIEENKSKNELIKGILKKSRGLFLHPRLPPKVLILGTKCREKERFLYSFAKLKPRDLANDKTISPLRVTILSRYQKSAFSYYKKKLWSEERLSKIMVFDFPEKDLISNKELSMKFCDFAILFIDISRNSDKQIISRVKFLQSCKIPFMIVVSNFGKFELNSFTSIPIEERKDSSDFSFIEKYLSFLKKEKINLVPFKQSDCKKNDVEVLNLKELGWEISAGLYEKISKLSSNFHFYSIICIITQISLNAERKLIIDAVIIDKEIFLHDEIDLIEGGQDGYGRDKQFTTNIRQLYIPNPCILEREKNPFVPILSISKINAIRIITEPIEEKITFIPNLIGRSDCRMPTVTIDIEGQKRILKRIFLNSKGEGIHVNFPNIKCLTTFLFLAKIRDISVASFDFEEITKEYLIKKAHLYKDNDRVEQRVMLIFGKLIENSLFYYAEKQGFEIIFSNNVNKLIDLYLKFKKRYSEDINLKQFAIFPVQLRMLSFNSIIKPADPLIIEVKVEIGVLHIETPLYIYKYSGLYIGTVSKILCQHIVMDRASSKDGVLVVKISNPWDVKIDTFFDQTFSIFSVISRRSIDAVRKYYWGDLSKEEQELLYKLKDLFEII